MEPYYLSLTNVVVGYGIGWGAGGEVQQLATRTEKTRQPQPTQELLIEIPLIGSNSHSHCYNRYTPLRDPPACQPHGSRSL